MQLVLLVREKTLLGLISPRRQVFARSVYFSTNSGDNFCRLRCAACKVNAHEFEKAAKQLKVGRFSPFKEIFFFVYPNRVLLLLIQNSFFPLLSVWVSFQKKNSKVRLAKIDGMEERDIGNQYGIKKFPTLHVVKNGKKYPYKRTELAARQSLFFQSSTCSFMR